MTPGELQDFFQKYSKMVFRRALTILGNPQDAEEAVQDIFIKVLVHGEGFDGRCKITTWLYRVTTNHCLNQIRDKKRRQELMGQNSPPPSAQQPQLEVSLALQKLLAQADPLQAQVAVYVYIDGMSHSEVAEIIDVSRRTVGNLLERFNQWAKELLQDSQQEQVEA